MFVERIEMSGFGGLPRWSGPLDRVARIAGAPRARVAVADALQLAFGAFDAEALRAVLGRWGCGEVVVSGSPLPEGAQWLRGPGLVLVDAAAPLGPTPPGLGGAVAADAEGLLVVAVTLSLDPPQFRTLRAQAARDPRLVDALAEGARLTLRVGARFSAGWDALALDLLAFVVGDVPFPVAGADRPAWITPFLLGLRGRLARGAVPPARWAERAASWSASDQRAVRRAREALAAPPFSLGDVVVLADGPALLDESAVVAVARHGAQAEAAVGLVGAVFLEGADVLVVDSPPADWLEWLAEQAEREASPLEQVIVLGAPDGVPLA